jgi:hypothetical protein
MYYFKLRGDDPVQTHFSEEEYTKDDLARAYVGQWLKTGDEEYDESQIIGIMTEEEANAYFEN